MSGHDAAAGPGDGPDAEDATDFPRQTDGFERLWTPHRMVYVAGSAKPDAGSEVDCPFCAAPGREDSDGLIVARGDAVYAVLNLYPYNPGHLLVFPYRHVADYTDLTDAETRELAAFTQEAMRTLRRVSGPAGFNLGMNQGAVAGAGIAAHLHQHVVPRFSGDANFLPIIAQTKALPQVHDEVRRLVSEEWGADA